MVPTSLPTTGIVAVFSAYTINGGGIYHMRAANGSRIINDNNIVTVIGTPAFTAAFASASSASIIETNNVWPPGPTGPRIVIDTAGGINSSGQPQATYFPGTSAGSLTAPGWWQ